MIDMVREDVKIKIVSQVLADITTEKNEFSIHASDDMYVSTKTKLEMCVLDDIEKSQIVTVERYQITDDNTVIFSMTKRFGFTLYKFIDIMIFIIEKYNL
ncbi:MAG TPA: hypothetical protein DEQ30_04905 [Porphyromonadaceae bacterium]|nr:hypothetical protein [Porphyromonadaceae bacterium]